MREMAIAPAMGDATVAVVKTAAAPFCRSKVSARHESVRDACACAWLLHCAVGPLPGDDLRSAIRRHVPVLIALPLWRLWVTGVNWTAAAILYEEAGAKWACE